VRTPAATPYLLPPEEAVEADHWLTADGAPVPERLDHWDPFTDIDLVRAITVDTDVVRGECRLPDDAALALVATWRSDRTRLAAAADLVELGTLDGTLRVPLTATIPGDSTGGRLELETALVLRSPGSSSSPIAPRRAGAILWTDLLRVVLDGSAARFPITVVDFTTIARLPDSGLWALDWSPEDLESPLTASMRLLINGSRAELLALVRSGSVDSRSVLLRRFVTYDVARTLVAGALANDRFAAAPETFEEGTLGRMLYELISLCWPGVPVPSVRRRMIEDAPRLESELQGHLEILS
jgi:hypothetical protein